MRTRLLVLLLAVFVSQVGAWACPMCKDSIPNSDAAQASSLPGGFNFSIYYMLIGLCVTIGLCATVIARGVRSTNARMGMSKDQPPMNDEFVIPPSHRSEVL